MSVCGQDFAVLNAEIRLDSMEFDGPVSNLFVQVQLATAFFPVVAHWLVFPTPLVMLSTKHNGSRFHLLNAELLHQPMHKNNQPNQDSS